MNKYLVSALTSVAVLGSSVAPALAVDVGARGLIQIRQEKRQEQRDQKQETRLDVRASASAKNQEVRASLEVKREQERRDRLAKFWSKSSARLQKIIDREVKLSTRIAERLAKLKAAGKDVARQEALLVSANASVAVAQKSLTDANLTLKTMMTDKKPIAEITAKARELHKVITGNIRVSYKALVDVIVSTRGMSATPTPSVSPTP
mgnify:CR=1 FL=1